ncbi:hypothetical protein G6O69_29530 [Pseudenhygromyxa sp. WMMC2535]|uniref:hypothetical protein n=1 Tax=Pseudenhygromyxa sp. WMMC2535 TaxID=2712867 RepID=UPI001552463B|nr:hypothetical protein [Pseudenhygromyxa sp. WMMC2535]NVB42004.1 hypothetical protein [Pseudenhygromyxa sp. WMMC2535]
MARPDPTSTPTSTRVAATRGARWAFAGLLLSSACVFGYRGEQGFSDEASLSGVDTVRIEVPPTQLSLVGDPGRTFIDWRGSFSTLGGTPKDALAQAGGAQMVWETWERIARLSVDIPAELREITVLDELRIESASYLDHEIVGTGDVFVTSVDAFLSVTLEGGNVEVLGGAEQIVIDTGRGDVTLSTAAPVDVRSGEGRVDIESEANSDIIVETAGEVSIALSSSSSLDIEIADAGAILIDLDDVAHMGSGSFRRVTGTGAATVQVRAGGGRVDLSMLASINTDTDTGS